MLDSIRTRLTLWYVGILALTLIAFAGLTYVLVVRVLAQETDENLAEMAQNFKTALEAEQSDEPKEISVEKDIRETIDELRFRDYSFAVYTADGRQIASTLSDLNFDDKLLKTGSLYSTVTTESDTFRVRRSALELGAERCDLFVLHSLREQANFLNRIWEIFLAAVPLSILLAASGGYFLARKSLAPVVDMSRQAANISATNLHERLAVKNEKDELGNLAQVINALLLRLENSFEQQRRFMADASHELRTPLAIVRGESEVALAKENRAAAEYRESLAIVHDESRRLTKIVEDLFTLARADAGQYKAIFTEIYLDEILADCVRAVRVLAEERKIKLILSSVEMPMRGDEQLLRRLFINLLDNAIKYNRNGGSVSVIGEKNNKFYRISVADTGRGISPTEQVKVFDRFYRTDKSRSRIEETATSGAGLGLSIARWIAGIHQSRLELVRSNESGTTFEVTFALKK